MSAVLIQMLQQLQQAFGGGGVTWDENNPRVCRHWRSNQEYTLEDDAMDPENHWLVEDGTLFQGARQSGSIVFGYPLLYHGASGHPFHRGFVFIKWTSAKRVYI